MAKTRSPNYPAVPLGDALESVRPAFKAENRNKMSRLVLAGHIGYTSLNGRALAKIGALRAYGLIEGSGDDLRISDDAITSLTSPDGEDKVAAMERCALHPPLFKEIHGEVPDGNVSRENLRYKMIQRRFTEDAAEKAAENYLATMRLVAEVKEGYDSGHSETQEPEMQTAAHASAKPSNQGQAKPALAIDPSGGRSLGRWDFETGGYVQILVDASVDTEEALDMVATLVEMKRKEVERLKKAPRKPDSGGEEK